MLEVVARPAELAGLPWAVECARTEPQLFRSGKNAEACARRLANRLAESGAGVRLTIFLRDGSVARALEVLPPSSAAEVAYPS